MITPQQRVSRKQEKRTAATYGGKVQPGSGSGWVHRNDVRAAGLLIENKTKVNPTSKSISIQAKDLEGLRINALRKGLTGVLQFDLNTRQYVILTEDDFLGYLEVRWEAEATTSDSNGSSSSSPVKRSGRSSAEGSALERLVSMTSSSPRATMMMRAFERSLSAKAPARRTLHAQ